MKNDHDRRKVSSLPINCSLAHNPWFSRLSARLLCPGGARPATVSPVGSVGAEQAPPGRAHSDGGSRRLQSNLLPLFREGKGLVLLVSSPNCSSAALLGSTCASKGSCHGSAVTEGIKLAVLCHFLRVTIPSTAVRRSPQTAKRSASPL